ncbi:MAG: shikimate kinase [Candidatus Symbiothrix sp.]|jgi:shikimate kinase|nr:shikimate kinase [Candidatus Symbiothrix sp.]
MQKIFLIGYMGAGKTTVGKHLAQALGLQFIDLDQFIENRYHKKVSELFAEKGETGFRELEKKALLEVSEFEDVIISTGGGTPCFFDNMQVMNAIGQTIYLKIPAGELAARLIKSSHKGTRPLLNGKTDDEIRQFVRDNLAAREPFYNQSSHIFEAGNLEVAEKLDHLVKNLIFFGK